MQRKRQWLAAKLFCCVLPVVFALSLPGQGMEKMKNQVQEKTLGNGMKFIVMERHETPVVSFHLYADVGSAQESYGITGISHILEHMAFKGTKIVGTKDWQAESKALDEMDRAYEQLSQEEHGLKPDPEKVKALKAKFQELEKKAKEYVINNEFFDMMMQQGDEGVNAYTNFDSTRYLDSLPSNRLEFWMAMTSDRFLNPVFREFYKERDVIMEERRLGIETQPTGKLVEDFVATSFKAHPYHHHVIGHMSDLQRITHDDVKEYFKKFYSPSNLTVAIVGDVKPEEVFRMAELYFGRIPGGSKPEPLRTQEPEQWGERRVEVAAQAQPMLFIGYHRPSVNHVDDAALNALANILSQGQSSRLWELLVKKEKVAVATQGIVGFPGKKYSNLIVFVSVPSKDRTSDESLKLIESEIDKIKKESVTTQELTKYKQTTKKNLIDQMKTNDSMAWLLANYDVVQGDWRLVFDELSRIDRITAADVQRVANTYLTKTNRTIGQIVPETK